MNNKKEILMKKVFEIEVDCAVCAGKCAEAISKIKGVTSCKINFIMQEMEIEAEDGVFDAVLKKAVKVAKGVEPDFEIKDER